MITRSHVAIITLTFSTVSHVYSLIVWVNWFKGVEGKLYTSTPLTLFLNYLDLSAASTSCVHLHSSRGLQFLRDAVWHYSVLHRRATEEYVKEIPVKQEDCSVTYINCGCFCIREVSEVLLNSVLGISDTLSVRVSVQHKGNKNITNYNYSVLTIVRSLELFGGKWHGERT